MIVLREQCLMLGPIFDRPYDKCYNGAVKNNVFLEYGQGIFNSAVEGLIEEVTF